MTPPLRILGMVASPNDLPPLDVAREKQRVENAIQALRANGLVELTWLAGQTWRDLQRAMRVGPWHVFHFIGHGSYDRQTEEGCIALADEEGQASRLSATQLGRLLADHRSLRMVLLNACEGARGSERDIFSSAAAILVRRGIPAVLAMQYEITDRAAIEFSRTFYEALADEMPVDAAVAEARKAISMMVANTVEWGTPVLYMRSPDGVLFNLEVARQARKTTERLERERVEHEAQEKAAQEETARKAQEAEWLEQERRAREAKEQATRLEAERVERETRVEATKHAERKARMEAAQREAEQQAKLAAEKAEAERLQCEHRDQEARIQAAQEAGLRARQAEVQREPVARFRLPAWAFPAAGGALMVVALAVIGWRLSMTAVPVATVTRVPTTTPLPPSTLAAGATRIAEGGMAMVYVPAGNFSMGSSDSDKQAYSDEKPLHEVYVDAFWIDRTEVTNV